MPASLAYKFAAQDSADRAICLRVSPPTL